VLNADNRHFARLSRAARAAGIDRIIPFGSGEDAEVRLMDCDLAPHMSRITAQIRGRRLDYHLPLPGRHLVINSLGLLATVDALGADVARAAASLARLAALDGRGRRHVVHAGAGDFTVIDESYNANPASIRAAAATLANMQPDGGGRRVVVLGDMRELGAASAAEHANLAPVLKAAAIELVFTTGTEMAHLWNALPAAMQGGHADHADALAPMVAAAARPGDVFTVKGSLAGGLRAVVDALLARGAAPARPAPMADG
jgi:UDP-N-acetylmuramoyl-tripeptide--D-alanyl-D-alanine ligase